METLILIVGSIGVFGAGWRAGKAYLESRRYVRITDKHDGGVSVRLFGYTDAEKARLVEAIRKQREERNPE